jgi:hypothetical protein
MTNGPDGASLLNYDVNAVPDKEPEDEMESQKVMLIPPVKVRLGHQVTQQSIRIEDVDQPLGGSSRLRGQLPLRAASARESRQESVNHSRIRLDFEKSSNHNPRGSFLKAVDTDLLGSKASNVGGASSKP